MKLVVLGASGGCGRELTKQALERGHEVVAVGRQSSTIEERAGQTIARGSIFDEDFLAATFEGADAVLSGLGPRMASLAPWAKPEMPDMLERSTPVVVEAMQRAGVERVVAISSGGVGDSRDLVPGFMRFFVKVTSLKHAFRDLEAMEQAYRESDRQVCCVRPTGLTDEPRTGKAVVATGFTGRAQIPRADVAAFMLDLIEGGPFPSFGPMITVTGAA